MEHTSATTVSHSDVVVQYFSITGLLDGLFGWRVGHPWNAWQTSRRGTGQWRAAALQQELSVVDDPGTFWTKRKKTFTKAAISDKTLRTLALAD